MLGSRKKGWLQVVYLASIAFGFACILWFAIKYGYGAG